MEDNRDEPGNEEKLVRHELETEKAIEEMMSEVTKKFALQHFIKYAKYIVCQLVEVFNMKSAKDLYRPGIRC